MSSAATAALAVQQAVPQAIQRAAETSYEGINPIVIGIVAFLVLLFMLWVTLQFNKDR
ncbi:MAG: hypothetical protein ACRDPK_12645 [Carbonactinosporaceae bacterium]